MRDARRYGGVRSKPYTLHSHLVVVLSLPAYEVTTTFAELLISVPSLHLLGQSQTYVHTPFTRRLIQGMDLNGRT